MATMARASSFSFFALLSCLAAVLHAYTPDPGWLVPAASKPDLSTTWYNGNTVTLSWQTLNSSICDLWLTGTSNSYAVRIATNINLDNPGTLPWTIDVGAEQIQISDQFVFRFIPTGTPYEGASQAPQIDSPAFVLLAKAGPAASTTGTITATATDGATVVGTQLISPSTAAAASSSIPTSTAAASPPPPGGGLSTGVKVGAAIAAIAAIFVIFVLVLWVVRLRRRVKAASNHRSQGIVPETKPRLWPDAAVEMTKQEKRISGLHEVHGDKTQPQELSTMKERQSIYEMAG